MVSPMFGKTVKDVPSWAVVSCPSTATSPSRDACISSTSVSILRSGELRQSCTCKSRVKTATLNAEPRAAAEQKIQPKVLCPVYSWSSSRGHISASSCGCSRCSTSYHVSRHSANSSGGSRDCPGPLAPLGVPHLSALQTAPTLLFPTESPPYFKPAVFPDPQPASPLCFILWAVFNVVVN